MQCDNAKYIDAIFWYCQKESGHIGNCMAEVFWFVPKYRKPNKKKPARRKAARKNA